MKGDLGDRNNKLLLNPQETFHLSGLCKHANVPTGNALKGLKSLADMDLVKVEHGARGAMYRLNKDHGSVPHLFAIFSAEDETVVAIRDAVEALPVNSAFIFGSFAAGTHKADSDIDLMLVSDKISNVKANALLRPLARQLNKTINAHVVKTEEFDHQTDHPDGFWAEALSQVITLKTSRNEKD